MLRRINKDVKTLNHLLKEYGNAPGKNMPTASKDLGFSGKGQIKKASKVPTDMSKGPAINMPKTPQNQSGNSPTIQSGGTVKAKDLSDTDAGKEVLDKTNKSLGNVVAPVGKNPQNKFLVVQKGNETPTVIDPEEDVFVKEPTLKSLERIILWSGKGDPFSSITVTLPTNWTYETEFL
mgnify:CR=1 FL=1